jgi:hypothetical protein
MFSPLACRPCVDIFTQADTISRVLMGLNEQRIAATIGWNLLKKKSDHIKKLLQDVLKKILQAITFFSNDLRDYLFL